MRKNVPRRVALKDKVLARMKALGCSRWRADGQRLPADQILVPWIHPHSKTGTALTRRLFSFSWSTGDFQSGHSNKTALPKLAKSGVGRAKRSPDQKNQAQEEETPAREGDWRAVEVGLKTNVLRTLDPARNR